MNEKRAGAVGRARYLRENRTTAESNVWRWLRGRKLIGWNEDIIGNPDGAWEHIAHVIAVRAAFVRQKNAFDPLYGDKDQ